MELILLYKIVVGLCALQRLGELLLSKSNEKWILSQGGRVIPETNYIFMVLLHTTWILALVYFTFFTELKILNINLFMISMALFCLGQFFRIHAIMTLGKRWSTRVCVLPKAPVIKSGLFKVVRHPNYVGVVLELLFLPLAVGLWKVAFFFTVLNAIILYFRIRFEERMLCEHNDYEEKFLSQSPGH